MFIDKTICWVFEFIHYRHTVTIGNPAIILIASNPKLISPQTSSAEAVSASLPPP